ncbi:hypothetical protein HDU76_010203, partial [Blyttiomyces sp. JEL0837]
MAFLTGSFSIDPHSLNPKGFYGEYSPQYFMLFKTFNHSASQIAEIANTNSDSVTTAYICGNITFSYTTKQLELYIGTSRSVLKRGHDEIFCTVTFTQIMYQGIPAGKNYQVFTGLLNARNGSTNETNLPKNVEFELQVYELDQDLVKKLGLTPRSSKVNLQITLTGHKVLEPEKAPVKVYFTGLYSSFTYVPTTYTTSLPSSTASKDKFSTQESFTPDLPESKPKAIASSSTFSPSSSSTSKALPTPPQNNSKKSKGKETLLSKNLFHTAASSDDDIIDLDEDKNNESDESDHSEDFLTTKPKRKIFSIELSDDDNDKGNSKRNTRSSSRKS